MKTFNWEITTKDNLIYKINCSILCVVKPNIIIADKVKIEVPNEIVSFKQIFTERESHD
jgi:hypothetical protein